MENHGRNNKAAKQVKYLRPIVKQDLGTWHSSPIDFFIKLTLII